MTKGILKQIEARILDMVKRDEIGPGGRLPSERALAEGFDVSRNTVREAIRALVEQGILVCRPNAGSFVAPDAPDRMEACLKKELDKRKLRLAEIFEVRKILEPAVAAQAALKIDPKGLDALSSVLEQQKQALETRGNPVKYDERFHDILVESTGNAVLKTLFRTLNRVTAEIRTPELQSLERASRSAKGHGRIVEALARGDRDGAFQAMTDHMDEIQDVLNKIIKE